MQQRQPRLGDIIDDYCPRERRITNHAVVAMVGHEVKQTRCTTCEAEHEYKHAKVPPSRKRKETVASLQEELLKAPDAPRPPAVVAPAAVPAAQAVPAAAEPAAEAEVAPAPRPRQRARMPKAAVPAAPPEPEVPPPSPAPVAAPPAASVPPPVVGTAPPAVSAAPPVVSAAPPSVSAAPPAAGAEPPSAPEPQPAPEATEGEGEDEGPVHRRLIRATLPRPEGQVARPTPQFTMRQPTGRPGGFGGKARGVRPHAGAGGRPHGGGGPKGARGAGFARGTSGADAFGRTRPRDVHPRHGRHPHAGSPSRPGKKHSK